MTKRNSYQRHGTRSSTQSKKPIPPILIVTEGEKAEPTYFKNIKTTYKIPIKIIDSAKDTAPIKIVKLAIKRFKTEPNEFSHVFVVFDCDNHHSYQEACKLCEKQQFITAIISNPCFELWLLLHFEDISSPLENAKQRLEKHINKYVDKIPSNLFELTKDHLGNACNRAQKLTNSGDRDKNPYTNVHVLIEKIEEMKQIRENWKN